MILFIDTTNFETAHIALVLPDGKIRQMAWQGNELSETLLPNVQKLLQKAKVKITAIQKIAVRVGPGGFSRTRTGVAIANAFGFALNIPIVALKVNESWDPSLLAAAKGQKMVAPVYGAEPNITMPKKKSN